MKQRIFRPRTRVAGRRSAIVLLALLPLAGAARGEDPEWVTVGSMTGAPADSLEDFVDNELFQEARTGELFQELGELEARTGYTKDLISADLRANFKCRVVDRHRILAPGSEVGPGDLSGFEAINSAIGKGVVTADFVDIPGPAAVRFEAEAGYSLTVAESRPGHATARAARDDAAAAEARLAELDARLPRRVLRRIGRGLVRTVDRLATGLGSRFEDTEKGAVYLEGFAEPLTLWADFGFPLPTKLFTAMDNRLRPGDAASHSAFFEIQPIVAGVRGAGMRVSAGTFYRFVRSTTVVKLADDEVMVQIKNLAARGFETIPLKIRPELRWFLLTYGYTLFDDRHDRARFQISEIAYRIDLKTEEGRAAFQRLLGEAGDVQFRPALEAGQGSGRGVRILRARLRGGNRWDLMWRARLPSWFDLRTTDLGVFQTVTEADGDRRIEASRGRTVDRRRKIFGRRQRRASTLATFATPVISEQARALEASGGSEVDAPPVLRLETAVRDRYATRAKRLELLELVAEVAPGADRQTLLRLAAAGPEIEGISLALRLELDRETVPAVLALSEERIWRVVAERLLGARYRDSWSARFRPQWRSPLPALDERGRPSGLHVSEILDRELWREDPSRREAWPNSRNLFARAEHFVREFEVLRGDLARGEIGRWPVWLPRVDPPADFSLLAGVFHEALGTFNRPGVSARAEVWLESMLRPTRVERGPSRLPRGPETTELPTSLDRTAVVRPPSVVDGSALGPLNSPTWTASADERGLIPDVSRLRSSPPRLAAGRIQVHRPSWPAEVRLRLELFSDFRFDPSARLEIELRRSRIRTDLAEDEAELRLPEPEAVPEGPFMIAQFRYLIDLPFELDEPGEARTLYLRVENAAGEPISEQQPLRFRASAVEKAAEKQP